MKTINFRKIAAYIAVSAFVAVGLSSCDKKKEDKKSFLDGDVISGTINEDFTLTSNQTWYLKGDVIVESGKTLTIEPGTEIVAKSEVVTYLLVQQGAKIMAEGTKESPIIFTADKHESGAWGSIHICGYAPINKEGGTGSSEIGDATYGGTDANDNSGVLTYCVFEYSGTALDEEHEANGISLYGVGAGTTIEHVQVYMGGDDGIEFFGGTANVKYAYMYGCSDDSFDWTQGWSGKGQYWLAVQADGVGDRGIEADNSSSNNQATPYANPTLSQVTLIGGYANGDDAGVYGMKLREGTKGQIYNVVVTGFDKRTIHVEHNQTLTNVNNGELVVDYAVLNDDVSDKVIKYSVSEIANPNYDANDPNSEEFINDPNGPVVDDAKKFENSANVTIETVSKDASFQKDGAKDMSSDSFFTADTKIGAGNSWLAGWTK